MNIAFICRPGLEGFLHNITDHFQRNTNYSVMTAYTDDARQVEQAVRNSHIVWCEWANEMAEFITRQLRPVMSRRKLIIRLHSYEAMSPFIGRIDYSLVDGMIFVAEHVRELVAQRWEQENLIKTDFVTQVIPNGLDVEKYTMRPELDLGQLGGVRIAFLGNISYKKGPILLMHAFHALLQESPRAKLFVGGGWQDMRMQIYMRHIVRELGMEDSVQFDGYVKDVNGWLQDKEFIVCTSPWEGCPVGILEGMACGLRPVIHQFPGAQQFYPEKWLWRSIPEFVEQIMNCFTPMPKKYRDYVKVNFNLMDQLANMQILVDELAESLNENDAQEINAEISPRKTVDECTAGCVMAVKNVEDTLDRALASLEGQTKPFSRVVVVNDGSTDKTRDMLNTWVKQDSTVRRVIHNAESMWVFKARNLGVTELDTDYLMFLDGDDHIPPDYVKNALDALLLHGELSGEQNGTRTGFAYPGYLSYFKKGESEAYRDNNMPEWNPDALTTHNYVAYASLISTEAFKGLGGFSEYLNDTRNHGNEWDLWLRMVAAGYEGVRVERNKLFYQHDPGQMSKNHERAREDFYVQMVRGLDPGWVPERKPGAFWVLLVCRAQEYLAKKSSLRALKGRGTLFTFFYDVERQYWADTAMQRLMQFVNDMKPDVVLTPWHADNDVPLDVWRGIQEVSPVVGILPGNGSEWPPGRGVFNHEVLPDDFGELFERLKQEDKVQ